LRRTTRRDGDIVITPGTAINIDRPIGNSRGVPHAKRWLDNPVSKAEVEIRGRARPCSDPAHHPRAGWEVRIPSNGCSRRDESNRLRLAGDPFAGRGTNGMGAARFDKRSCQTNLDPTMGSEIEKPPLLWLFRRDEMNVARRSSGRAVYHGGKRYHFRIPFDLRQAGFVGDSPALRADRQRSHHIMRKLGRRSNDVRHVPRYLSSGDVSGMRSPMPGPRNARARCVVFSASTRCRRPQDAPPPSRNHGKRYEIPAITTRTAPSSFIWAGKLRTSEFQGPAWLDRPSR